MVNKTEGTKLSDQTLEVLNEALSFGFGDPIPISAAHGEGLSDIAEIIVQSARKRGYPIQSGAKTVDVDHEAVTMTPKALEDRMIQIAIMGRPNVGKSSILNAILGSERVIVGPVPGLTRDSVYVNWSFFGRQMRLVDTAGLTHLSPDQRILKADKADVSRLEATVGKHAVLPGRNALDKESVPSQHSYKIAQMCLNELDACRMYADVDELDACRMYADIDEVDACRMYADIDELDACRMYADVDELDACRMYVDIDEVDACRMYADIDELDACRMYADVDEVDACRMYVDIDEVDACRMYADVDEVDACRMYADQLRVSIGAASTSQGVGKGKGAGGQGSFTRLDLQLARKCLQEGRALVIAANKFDLLKEGMSTQQYEDG
eukprot:gene4784-6087_t